MPLILIIITRQFEKKENTIFILFFSQSNVSSCFDRDESEPEYIVDDSAEMPSGWLEDESELVPDPDAEKPDDW